MSNIRLLCSSSNKNIILLSIAATMPMFWGLMLSVGMNLPMANIKQFVNISLTDNYLRGKRYPTDGELATLWGVIISSFFVFNPLGCLLVPHLNEKYGRKFTTFVAINGCIFLATPLMFIARYVNRFELFWLGRMFAGFGNGLANGTCMLYVIESSPPKFRAGAGNVISITALVSIVLCMIATLPHLLGSEELWHFIFIVPFLPCCCTFLLYFVVPESPKYMCIKRRDDKTAAKTIELFYEKNVNVKEVLASFKREETQSSKHVTIKELLTTPHLRAALFVGSIALQGRMLCGYDIFTSYSTQVFQKQLEVDQLTSQIASIAMQAPIIFEGLILMWLIDRINRRKLFLFGLSVMVALNILFTLFSQLYLRYSQKWMMYSGLASLVLSCWTFPLGPTPIGFMLMSEIVPQSARASSVMVSTLLANVTRFLSILCFPIFESLIGSLTFLINSIVPCTLVIIYLYFKMPDSGQKSVDQVVEIYMNLAKRAIPRGSLYPT